MFFSDLFEERGVDCFNANAVLNEGEVFLSKGKSGKPMYICRKVTKPQNDDINRFVEIVSRCEHLADITPEQMQKLIERIEVHAPDKSSGHRQRKIDIFFRFKVVCASVTLDGRADNKKKKAA